MNWMDFPNDGLSVHGLAWFEEDRALCRLQLRRLRIRPFRYGRHSARTDGAMAGMIA